MQCVKQGRYDSIPLLPSSSLFNIKNIYYKNNLKNIFYVVVKLNYSKYNKNALEAKNEKTFSFAQPTYVGG